MANKKKDTPKQANAQKATNAKSEAEKPKKKGGAGKVVTIISALLLVIIGVVLFLVLSPKPVPYVVANELEVVSAKNTFKNRIQPYTMSLDGEVIDIGNEFKETSASYKFYDYTVSEPDEKGIEIISFKYDTTAQITFTRKDYSYKEKYYYTYSLIRPIVFDYYTGEQYLRNSVNSDAPDSDKTLKINDITWSGKTYPIGILVESESEWDGKEEISKDIFTDTNRTTTTVSISAPKGYDGLMVAIFNPGLTEELFAKNRENSKKLEDLKEQAEKTGEKSEELLKLEGQQNTATQLLKSTAYEDLYYEPSDFTVIWVNDITSAE